MDKICSDEEFFNLSKFINSERPEFSECFLNTVPSWSLSVLIGCIAPFHIYSVRRMSHRRIGWTKVSISRLILLIVVIIVNCIRFANDLYTFIASGSRQSTPFVVVLSSLLNIFSYSLFAYILLLHRKHGVHTSWIEFVITLVAVLLTLPSLYTCLTPAPTISDAQSLYKIVHERQSFGVLNIILQCIHTLSLIIILVLTCFVDQNQDQKEQQTSEITPLLAENRIDRFSMDKKRSPLETCSFFSRITFGFATEILSRGYKNILRVEDMYYLRNVDTNAHLHKKWTQAYSRNHSVFRTTLQSPLFYVTMLSRICSDALMFVQPQILKYFLGLFTPGVVFPIWNGYALAGAFFLTSMLRSLIMSNSFFLTFIFSHRIKSALNSSIYKRSLMLSNEERVKTTSGEIINLVSVDAQRFTSFLTYIHLLWSLPLQVVIYIYFLYIELGVAIFAGVTVLVLFIPINTYISKFQQDRETKQLEKKDERMKVLNEILNGIKVIKLYGWEIPFINRISKLRAEEVEHLKWLGIAFAFNNFVWTCIPTVVSFCAFAVYVGPSSGNVLTIQEAFVTLALFEGLRFPLGEIAPIVTDFVTKLVSVRRLDKFLNDTAEIVRYVQRKKIQNGKLGIMIENGTFSWREAASKPELKDINLRIKKGSIVAIVGNVAMGKSSLINAILGNMKLVSGNVFIDSDSKVAYVAQQAWIQNATLKNNILFGSRFNSKHYRKVINICALEDDLATLPAGDMTEIGERGINLSGGQKQRIAMARACYSDCNLFLFDDPLSAVDSHVGKHIFDHVLSSKTGFLKEQTRVFVTNNIQFLPDVDQIIVVSNGTISDVGTYQELIANGSDFAEFLQEYSNIVEEDKVSAEHHEASLPHKAQQIYLRSFSTDSNHELENDSGMNQLIDDEKVEIGKVDWRIYWKYIEGFTILWILVLIIGYIFNQIGIFGNGLWLAHWSQDSVLSTSNSTVNSTFVLSDSLLPTGEHSQMYYLRIYGLIGVFQILFSMITMIAIVIGVKNTSVVFHKTLIWGVMRSPISFFDTTPVGRILNRFSKDIDTIDNEVGATLDGYIACLMQVITTFSLIIYKLPIFSLIIVPMMVVYHNISKYFVTTSRQIQRLESISKSPIYSHFTETLSGIATIRAFGAEERFLNEISQRIDTNIRCTFPRPIINRWLSLRLEIMGSFILLLVTVMILIYRESFMTVPGLIGLLVSYSMYMTDNLNWIVRMSANLETNIVSVERVQEYSDLPPEDEWTREKNREPRLENEWPKGRIEFVDYSLRYRDGLDLVIKDLNLQIKPGEKIGIVGRTGAGKSSLTLALFRIIEAASGTILIDGVDIKKIGLHELRSKLSIIPQDPILFSGTIRSNLDPFASYDNETVWRALEHSHLKEFVSSLEDGLEYTIAENGENLSVGQRQLICLGRALLRHTRILVLDEATASVDLETDSLIQNTIREEFVGSTIITIAHRLNTILDYDRVMVLDQGRLVEFDSPDNLLANTASHFYSLAKDARII